jgi:hypothetical protein
MPSSDSLPRVYRLMVGTGGGFEPLLEQVLPGVSARHPQLSGRAVDRQIQKGVNHMDQSKSVRCLDSE